MAGEYKSGECPKLHGVAKAAHVEGNLFCIFAARRYAESWAYPLIGEGERYRMKRKDVRVKPNGVRAVFS